MKAYFLLLRSGTECSILKQIKTNVKRNQEGKNSMYGIPDSLKPLSEAEEQVLLALWA